MYHQEGSGRELLEVKAEAMRARAKSARVEQLSAWIKASPNKVIET